MAGKGILAILAEGKGKPMPGGDDAPGAPPSDKGSPGDGVGERASQDVLDAITAGDAKGLYDALERVVKACQSEPMGADDAAAE